MPTREYEDFPTPWLSETPDSHTAAIIRARLRSMHIYLGPYFDDTIAGLSGLTQHLGTKLRQPKNPRHPFGYLFCRMTLRLYHLHWIFTDLGAITSHCRSWSFIFIDPGTGTCRVGRRDTPHRFLCYTGRKGMYYYKGTRH